MDMATLGIKVENGQIVATSGALDRLAGAGAKAESQFGRLKGAAAALGVTLGAGAVFGKFVRETIDAQNAMAQLEARVKSTGMAAGFSAPQLAAMASEMQRLTTFSDDAVMGAQSLLLTFTKIQGDTLPAATQAVADLATAMGGDLKGAALQVGKALQDPEQGLLALRRSGVSFSEVQQEIIKGLFATGREAEAQAMILAELRKEFGGAAAAARDTFGGALTGLSNAFGDLFEVSKAGTSGIVGFINATTNGVEALNEMRGAITGVAVALGAAGLAGALAIGAVKVGLLFGGVTGLTEALVAARLAAAAFWTTVTGPVGLAIAGLTAVSAITAKIFADDAKANAAMDAREEADRYMAQQALKRRRERIDAEKEIGLAEQARQLKAQADAKKEAEDNAKALAGLEAKARFAKVLADAQEEVNKKLEREFRLRQMNAGNKAYGPQVGGFAKNTEPFTRADVLGRAPGWSPSPFNTTDLRTTAEIQRDKNRADARVKLETEAEGRIASARERITDNFLRGTQEAFARTFENIFTKGVRSFTDLFRTFGDLAKQAAAQLAASGLMNFLTGTYAKGAATGSGGIGSVLGGVGAVASAIPGIGAVIAGVALIGSKMLGFAKDNEEAQHRFELASKKWRESFDQFIRGFSETDFERQRRALGDQFKALADAAIAAARERIPGLKTLGRIGDLDAYRTQYLPSTIAAKSDVTQTLLKALDDLSAAYRRQQDALGDVLKLEEERYAADLRVRQLRAAGMDDEAEALALFNQQVREFADAVKAGFSAEFLAALSKTLEYERLALAAQQAADAQRELAEAQERAAESARGAAERLAAAQERAAEFAVRMADATESLAVRMLRATGNATAADKQAFALQQKQEIRAAEREIVALRREREQLPPMMFGNSWNYKDYWGGPLGPEAASVRGQVASINQMIIDQLAYIAELKTVQAAEAAAFTAGQGLPAVSASQGGSFNTIVSRTTAEQGDRMVDNLVTMRTLAQEFWPYLKTIADRLSGGVNTMLGSAYQQSAALAGSSLVS